ncbi:hypothetical protein C2S52_014211 [Perilla frutescens var. hirtella]|nr:hypothetical protein C2S52_014211 [Perilla frutescens var. hirtella]
MRRRARGTVNHVKTYGDGDNWRCCQLAEFLQERSARKQESAGSQDLVIGSQNQVTLFDELLFKILILLPAQSLFRLQFVCKKWFEIINSSIFIRCHAQQSETVLICRKLTLSEENSRPYFHFMDLDRGGNRFMESSSMELFDILASCDGLILVRFGKRKKLMIMNPTTRSQVVLPEEKKRHIVFKSFGIVYSNEAKTYSVVHLYFEKFGRAGCEILCICTRQWKSIEAPPFELVRGMTEIPVTVGESLYWMDRPCSYYLTMSLHDEKFVCREFPVSRTAYWDKLMEMEGRQLGFVNHVEIDVLQVWILMDEGGLMKEKWVKMYSLNLGMDVTFYIPICSTRNGKEMVIEGPDNKMYVFNFERGEMKLVHSRNDDEAWGGWVQKHHIPHRDTLVSCHVR